MKLNEQDPIGNTPLMWAVANAQTQEALRYIDAGAELGIQDTFIRNTALHLAVAKGWNHVDTEKNDHLPLSHVTLALLQHGANTNIQDKNGNTPLHIAVVRRDIEAIDALLKHGAKSDIKNKKNKKPLKMVDMTYAEAQDFLKTQCQVYTLPTQEEWESTKEEVENRFKYSSLVTGEVKSIPLTKS